MNEAADTDTVDDERWRHCYERLQRIRAYEFDWNDEGATQPSEDVTALAKDALIRLQAINQRSPDQCFATDEGHVIIVWESQENYFEIEIDAGLRCTARELPRGASRAVSFEFSQSEIPSLCLPSPKRI